MENYLCKSHSTKKASHYCCIEKVLFCESCLKSHDGHLIYTIKEVEELKKTGVDLLKNINNQNTKQTANITNKPAGPKIDLNALAASLDKKEEKNQVINKPQNTQNAGINPVSASNNNIKLNTEQNNLINKPSNLVKTNTISNPILANSANQVKNANGGGNTSIGNSLNSLIDNAEKSKETGLKSKETINISKPSMSNINQNDWRAPKNELNLVDMIIDDNKDIDIKSNYNTYSAPSLNKEANKINNLNDQTSKNSTNTKPLVSNAIKKSDDAVDKNINIKNSLENNTKQIDKPNTSPVEEKTLSIKERLNQLNSNNKVNEINAITKQTSSKQEEKKKDNTQTVNPITPSSLINNSNKDSQPIQSTIKTNEKSEVKIETNIDIDDKPQEILQTKLVAVKEEARVTEQTPKLENKIIEETKANILKENKDKEKAEQLLIPKAATEERKEINIPHPIQATKEVAETAFKIPEEKINNVKEIPKSNLDISNNNSLKEEEKSNKVQNVSKTLEENNIKPKPEPKLNQNNTLKQSEAKFANPIKEEKASNNEIKGETVAVGGNKNENFNKMKEMLGKRLSGVMAEKGVQPKGPEQTEKTDTNPTNVYKHTETSELKEVRKDNFKKAFADLDTCFINRTKPKEAPSINIPEIQKQSTPSSKVPSVPNKIIPKPPMLNFPSRPSALDLPLPPPINLANVSTIPDKSKESSENKNLEGKKNIPKAPPLILNSSEKKVIKNEVKNEAPKEVKREVKLPPPEPKRMSMLDELKKKVSLRSGNLNNQEP